MILTGKVKEYFTYSHNMSNFNDYSEVLQHALIIEWFDSAGIYVSVRHLYDGCNWEFEVETEYISVKRDKILTRKEATKQAIIKANEIYNEMFK